MLTRKGAFARPLPALKPLSLALVALAASQAQAFEFDTGNPDLRVRWDNTLKYSAAWRTQDASSKLTEGQTALNLDDGDRNFDKGLISNRLDLLSELDITYNNVGARVSGAAWYDDVYNQGLTTTTLAVPTVIRSTTTRSPTTRASCMDARASCSTPLSSARPRSATCRCPAVWVNTPCSGARACSLA